jgi:hypothetical protein
MLTLNADVFDEVITGTVTTWYTSAALNQTLGDADFTTFFVLATSVKGSPSLSIFVDHSADNRTWIQATNNLLISPLTDNVMGQLSGPGSILGSGLSFLRLRILLSGTTPGCGCRLKISVTGRNAN